MKDEHEETGKFKSEEQLMVKKTMKSKDDQTASGNINPLVTESLNDSRREKMPKAKSKEELGEYLNEAPIKKLDFNYKDISNSFDLSTINNGAQYQSQIIQKLNEEMQRLLLTLSQLDQEN